MSAGVIKAANRIDGFDRAHGPCLQQTFDGLDVLSCRARKRLLRQAKAWRNWFAEYERLHQHDPKHSGVKKSKARILIPRQRRCQQDMQNNFKKFCDGRLMTVCKKLEGKLTVSNSMCC